MKPWDWPLGIPVLTDEQIRQRVGYVDCRQCGAPASAPSTATFQAHLCDPCADAQWEEFLVRQARVAEMLVRALAVGPHALIGVLREEIDYIDSLE